MKYEASYSGSEEVIALDSGFGGSRPTVSHCDWFSEVADANSGAGGKETRR